MATVAGGLGRSGPYSRLINWGEESCVPPEDLTVVENTDIRKWNSILLRGEAGMTVLKGLLITLEMYKLSPLVGVAKVFIHFLGGVG